MIREDLVRVQLKQGVSAASFAAGAKYALRLAAGETAEMWEDGSPITRAEFEAVLEREGVFEIAAEE